MLVHDYHRGEQHFLENPRVATVQEANHHQRFFQESLENLAAVLVVEVLNAADQLLVLHRVLAQLFQHPLVKIVDTGAAVCLHFIRRTSHALHEHLQHRFN